MQHVVIPRYFRGPPETSNGGYAAGLAAQLIDDAAIVRLFKPPPIDVTLQARAVGDSVDVLDAGGDKVLQAAPRGQLSIDLPDVDLDEARTATAESANLEKHAAPSCVVCGPGRPDGFGIFPGRLDGTVVATSWRIPTHHVDPSGGVPRPIVWAVLDCPGGWSFEGSGTSFFPALVSQSVDIATALRPGEEVIVLGWELGRDGRKLHAGSALLSLDGEPLAISSQTCVAVPAKWAKG